MKKLKEIGPNIGSNFTLLGVDVADGVNGYRKNFNLGVKKNKISFIEQNRSEGVLVDGSDYILLPGMINSHTHCAMGFLRGAAHDVVDPINNLFFRAESQLDETKVEQLSYGYIASGLKSGVTTFFDHYYFSLGVGRALEKLGARGFIGETLADTGGAFPNPNGLELFIAQTKNWPFSELVKPILCPHATDTVSKTMAHKIAEAQQKLGLPLHSHLSQTKGEWDFCLKTYGKSPIAVASDFGWLGKNSQMVHVIYAENLDWKLLKDSQVHLVCCPSSAIIYDKLADTKKWIEEELTFHVASDCAASADHCDLWTEIKVMALMLKNQGYKNISVYGDIYNSVTSIPADFVNCQIGQLKQGYLADFIFIKKNFEMYPINDLFTYLLFSVTNQKVEHVVVDGKFVVWDHSLVNLDEQDFYVPEIKY